MSTASHNLPHFLSEHVSMVKKIKDRKFGADQLIFVETESLDRDNLKGDIELSKNINALPLHTFIKKFLKIFQAHQNSIASPHPSASEVSSKWTSKRILPQRRLVAIQSKMTIFRILQCNGQQVLLKMRCLLLCFPETRRFSV